MKIATFNVNGIRARLPNLLEWLKREQPDIACLQELKCADFPSLALKEAGYESIAHGQKSWNGVAILARGERPIETRRGLPGNEADTHSRYIETTVSGLTIGCLYLPNGNPQPGPKFDYKLAWMDHFNAYANTLIKSRRPVILAGDYNVVPTDNDIYNPRSWRHDALLQPEPRARFQQLLAQDWTDATRAKYPNEKIFTFWDYFRQHWNTDSGLRIDFLLLNPPAAKLLKSTGVHRWVRGQKSASDHAPTWIELI